MENVCLRIADTTPLCQVLHLWLEACASKGVSRKTLKTYRTQVEPFVFYLVSQGCATLDDVTPQHIRRWLLYWREQGVSAETLWDYYRNPRTFWNWCVREGLTEHNPFAKVEPPRRARTVKQALSPEEVEKLLRACEGKHWTDLRNRALVLCLVSTGLRVHEALSLTVGHASQETVVITGKGNKQRVVVLSVELRLALQRYLKALKAQRKLNLDASSPLWWSTTGKPMTLDGLKVTIRKLGAKAGMKLGAHCLRRTFGTWCIVNGMNPQVVKEFLGHSDLSTTMLYLNLTERDLLEAYRAHDPLRLLKR
ncbi:MAG: tyrosine recombinase XerD [Armatimonadota bacterium]|nr:MAG: tyrosine recombinase XerD [Armatimonadota bacterium]